MLAKKDVDDTNDAMLKVRMQIIGAAMPDGAAAIDLDVHIHMYTYIYTYIYMYVHTTIAAYNNRT